MPVFGYIEMNAKVQASISLCRLMLTYKHVSPAPAALAVPNDDRTSDSNAASFNADTVFDTRRGQDRPCGIGML